MAPRKKTSTGGKKSSHLNREPLQPSQPSKFGIQHFFERHSQSQKTLSQNNSKRNSDRPGNPISDSAAATNQNPQVNPKPIINRNPGNDLGPAEVGDENPGGTANLEKIQSMGRILRGKNPRNNAVISTTVDASDGVSQNAECRIEAPVPNSFGVNCETSGVTGGFKSISVKRFKFSPGMLIKQSQDDIIDEVTWKISPVNERLHAMSKNLPGRIRVETSPGMSGKLEKWLSSPPLKPDKKYLICSDGHVSRKVNPAHDSYYHGNNRNISSNDKSEVLYTQSPFSTPPSLSLCHGKALDDVDSNGVPDQLGSRQHKKVSEKHGPAESSGPQSFKVLRLLNEQSGAERALQLWDEWYFSVVAPGDTVRVIGEFDAQGKCDVNRERNFLIVHPDILVSGTGCPRRTILDERLKHSEHSVAALMGTLLHQIFQAGLISEFPTKEFLEEYARTVLQKSLESLYACGANENDIWKTLIEAIPKILNWISSFRDSEGSKIPSIDFKCDEGLKKIKISETAMEHSAQVMLYTLLMSERYMMNIEYGLLYYLHTDQTQGISVRRSDLIGLIMRRNELAKDLLKALTTQQLPPMLQAYGGNAEGSGLGDVYDSLTSHLTIKHTAFLRKWERLIDLEAKHLEDWRLCECAVIDQHFRVAHVILSTEPGHLRVANGVIVDIGNSHVSVSFAKRLRLPWHSLGSMSEALRQQSWRIDKDEVMSSFATMRYNLIQLFLENENSSRLRKLVVDLEMPRFDSGCIFSQDPAISYVWSENSLNDDQRRAILKILTAKDYALILGMPGTGKTSTMVHAVKAFYQHVQKPEFPNELIGGIDFIRIGRNEAVHEEIQENCLSVMDMDSTREIKEKLDKINVVAVTCLGITSPLLTNKRFDICIMDEAGQITLPNRISGTAYQPKNMAIRDGSLCPYDFLDFAFAFVLLLLSDPSVSLGPLMFASKFVLVGDHYQLPPLVQSPEAKENGMSVSLFCRLSEAHPHAIAALHCQYRMCAAIMELSNALIYGNRLRCGSAEIENAKLKYRCSASASASAWMMKVLNPNQPVIFINTDLLPAYETNDRKALNNPMEAYIIAEVTKSLILRGIGGQDIGIITPYNSQADLIRGAISEPVEIHTIDKYQGRDKDCILVSFVRSSKNPRNNTSSLLGDWHRINVALTRAKKKLIMVGSCETLSKVPLLKLLIDKVEELSGMLVVSKKEININLS
ncbi:hypothetical protein DH2020_046996 [Rehmannia glutinosa]|uniref:DNA replication ATP-dependent helicase/nuclease n=1 Tax=Rehmannia glutinosa TaxID=99300 RepID=A0ABR0U9P4_REHGL